MNDHEKFGEYLANSLRQEDPLPVIPRDEMWQRIREARRERRRSTTGGWLWRGLAVAATLVLGIGIGRFAIPRAQPLAPPTAAAARSDGAPSLPYQVAVAQHFASTEALLTTFSEDTRHGRTGDVVTWAQDLLVSTRLLRDSPAGRDPNMARLLDDLELVLVQIAALSAHESDFDLKIINDGIDKNDVLLRLRAVTAAPTVAGT